jgi:hypothetical protein
MASRGGRWITIGAKDADGKRRGGSPVYVEGGRITKGAPSLTGKKIAALDERGEGKSVRSANKSEKEYGWAVWAKKARGAGLRPADLHQLAADIVAHDAANVEDRKKMLRDARSALDHRSGAHRTIAASQGRGGRAIEDASQVRGLDEVAEQMAAEYPHLFHGRGHLDDQLFEMLSGRSPVPIAEGDAYEQAFDHLHQEVKAEDVVPFERRCDDARYLSAPVFGYTSAHVRPAGGPKERPMPSDHDYDLDELLEPERFERTAEVDRAERAIKLLRTKGYTGEAGWEKALAEVDAAGRGGTERFSRDANAQPTAERVDRAIRHMRNKGYGGEKGWERALAETK